MHIIQGRIISFILPVAQPYSLPPSFSPLTVCHIIMKLRKLSSLLLIDFVSELFTRGKPIVTLVHYPLIYGRANMGQFDAAIAKFNIASVVVVQERAKKEKKAASPDSPWGRI